METICPGWPTSASGPRVHLEPVILSDNGVPDSKVSHGACRICVAALNAQMDELEESRA